MRVFLMPVSLVVLAACSGSKEESDPEGLYAGECADGADNDGDGAYDCDDTDCAGAPDCGGPDENAAPSGAAIAITPAAPTDADNLVCSIVTEATDPNGDAVTYRYAWSVDGADAGVPGDTVSADRTSGGETWTCTVTPTDGTLDGAAASASVTVAQGNRAPSAPTVSITPSAPTDADVLTCVIDTESVDPDGDAVTYAYAWSVDGGDAGVTGATVNASLTEVGQQWTCAVTASDGELESSAASVSVEVGSSCVPALDLAGTGYATLPQYSSFDAERSYSVWVYPREGNGTILNDGYSGTSCASQGLNITSSMEVLIGVNGDPSCSPFDSAYGPTLDVDKWQHIAVVVDSTNVSFYLNGRLTSAETISAIDPYTPSRDLWVGVEANRPLSEIFDAALSDLALWDRALTGREVLSAYEDGPGSVSSGLVSWWPMDDLSETTLRDGSGMVGSGTVVGASWTYRCPDGSTTP